ncbi:MAG: MBL fold metallo-hydrolase [Pseudomonadales bacterium]
MVRASPQYDENAFVNPEPQASSTNTLSMLREQIWGKQKRTPPLDIPVVAVKPETLDAPPAQDIKAIWLGHSSVMVEMDGKRILLDPVLSEYASPFQFAGPRRFHAPPIKPEMLKNIDAVLLSHDHYDHLDMATVKHLSGQGTAFFVPLGIGAHLERWDVPASQIKEMDWWDERRLGDITIAATPNRHYSGRGLTDYKASLWSSWSIIGTKQRAFYSGDTGYSKMFSKIGGKYGPFDLTVIKVGAYGPGQAWQDVHMLPEEAIEVHRDVGGKLLLPVHWATFNMAFHNWGEPIERTLTAAKPYQIVVATPKIGEPVDPDQPKAYLPWWRPKQQN